MNHENKRRLSCMICGSQRHLLREGGVCLCSRCIGAMGRALAKKLGLCLPPEKEDDTPDPNGG